MRRFPYYIVRFKQILDEIGKENPQCFHTTQYDLNFPNSQRKKSQMLPFPYYIVRFKLAKDLFACAIFLSFHTTQYDLNLHVALWEAAKPIGFPYYIVRFKLMEGVAMFSPRFWFPYYIVRFKLSYRWKDLDAKRYVSILHSTI